MNARLKITIAIVALFSCAATSAFAAPPGSWMFRRSYYSHQPAANVQLGRPLTGGPFYTRPQGAYVNSGWRTMRSSINVGGQSYDHVNVRESWIQYGEQF